MSSDRDPREEFIVCHARGYPDPYKPWPQTRERAEEFARERGGELKRRLVTDWRTVADFRDARSTP